jgi:hypothetical protein
MTVPRTGTVSLQPAHAQQPTAAAIAEMPLNLHRHGRRLRAEDIMAASRTMEAGY